MRAGCSGSRVERMLSKGNNGKQQMIDSRLQGPVIDLMMDIPGKNDKFGFLRDGLRGKNKSDADQLPVAYLFKNAPSVPANVDPLSYVVSEMDKYGVARSLIDVTAADGPGRAAILAYPERFIGSFDVDPNTGMDGIRALTQAHSEGVVHAVSGMPAVYSPSVPIDDKRYYPVYAKCVELDLPIFITVGVPGPRVPMGPQTVDKLDEVCWFFPELKIVMRHGGEPWQDLAVKLMLKWPNLYYSTSGFAPKHYPRAIIDFANSRGREKILYAGYFPIALTLERIFAELPNIGLRDDVLPDFLWRNAQRLFGFTPVDR
jgi:uncharacterized protein